MAAREAKQPERTLVVSRRQFLSGVGRGVSLLALGGLVAFGRLVHRGRLLRRSLLEAGLFMGQFLGLQIESLLLDGELSGLVASLGSRLGGFADVGCRLGQQPENLAAEAESHEREPAECEGERHRRTLDCGEGDSQNRQESAAASNPVAGPEVVPIEA